MENERIEDLVEDAQKRRYYASVSMFSKKECLECCLDEAVKILKLAENRNCSKEVRDLTDCHIKTISKIFAIYDVASKEYFSILEEVAKLESCGFIRGQYWSGILTEEIENKNKTTQATNKVVSELKKYSSEKTKQKFKSALCTFFVGRENNNFFCILFANFCPFLLK